MIGKKLLVAFGTICVVMGVALSGNLDVMAKETQVYVQTEAGVEVQLLEEEMNSLKGGDEADMVRLPTPTSPQWGTNWSMTWDLVPEAEGYYAAEVYKDGELYDTYSWVGLNWSPVSVNFAQNLEENGVYKFRVQAKIDRNEEGLVDSEWSEFSEDRTFVRPDKSLPVVEAPVWVEDEEGCFEYISVEGAAGYQMTVYFIDENGEISQHGRWYTLTNGHKDVGGNRITHRTNVSDEGSYYVVVQALSGDVDNIFHGPVSEPSAILTTVKSINDVVREIIRNAVRDNTPSEAVKEIKEAVSNSVMANAMRTSELVLMQVNELEVLYAREKGIEIVPPAVSEEASQYVDSSKVYVVGARLNAEANTIGLEIDVPEKKEYINDQHYKNSVQLDISLENNGTAIRGNLNMPIQITMPIPAGIDARYLVVLHYNAEGEAEKIGISVNRRDNTVAFTVASLGTFALAEGSPFGDVKLSDWYYSSVKFVYENSLMAGKGNDDEGNNVFDPNKAIPREEFVQVLYNASGKPEPAVAIENKFPDVKNAWYKNAVLWANATDIANGKGDGNFGVTESISRQDLALMLYKYARLNGYDLTANNGEINKYADGNKVSSYAKTAMDWAITNGIMSGKGTKGEDISTFKLDPAGTATRAECAAMLKNFMDVYGDK